MADWGDLEGTNLPLGATWVVDAQAWNFAIYSKHAESVTLLLFGAGSVLVPIFQYQLDYLKNKSGRIWHCRVAEEAARGARYYAYRIAGPGPQGRFEWHCFDPDKLLLDPYARSVYFPAGFKREAAARPGSNRGMAPLGALAGARCEFDWGADAGSARTLGGFGKIGTCAIVGLFVYRSSCGCSCNLSPETEPWRRFTLA